MSSYFDLLLPSLPRISSTAILSRLNSDLVPLLISAATLFFLNYFLSAASRERALSKIPWTGLEYGNFEKRKTMFSTDAATLLQEGYEKVRPRGKPKPREYLQC